MLSGEQLGRFGHDGYLVVPGVVPERLLAALDDEIDALIASDAPPPDTVGKHFWFLPPPQLPAADAALRQSPALALAQELVAPHTLHHGQGHIQIALNIPPFRHKPGGPHIDGHGTAHEPPSSFTLLAGIYLVDEPDDMAGNLWVWPGSHLVHQRLFNERGTHALTGVGGHALHLDLPPPLGARLQITARRGDLLLAHFLLGHNTGGNMTDRTRRIAYYRLSCEGHRHRWEHTFLDAFTEYQPVRAAIPSRASG